MAKLLAEKLNKVVNNLVNKHKMTFIRGRQIMEATLTADDCLDSKGAKAGVMCKLDLEKAYDHVNLKFLLNILR